MTDLMDASTYTSLRSRLALCGPLNADDMALATPSLDQDTTMKDIVYLNQELHSMRQELERARNDRHRLNYALTSMVDYFTKDAEHASSIAVGSSLADDKPSNAAQPLISFDNDNFSEYHNRCGAATRNDDDTLLDSVCSNLVSISVSEPGGSWSSCATGHSTPLSQASGSSLQFSSQCGDGTVKSLELVRYAAASAVDDLENEIMELALDDAKDMEEGEILDKAKETGCEVMPDAFWNPDSPHTSNFLNLGINFKPEDAGADTLKTVLIQNLPPGVPTGRVLGNVRGGEVVSCTIVPSAGLQGYDAAYVHFKEASTAIEYTDFVRSHPLFMDGWQIIVEHIKTPTYPLSPQIHDAVYRYGCTRCLRIVNLAMSAAQLYQVLLRHFRTPLVIEGVHDDASRSAVIARFSSVEVAGRAWWLLKHSRYECVYEFASIEYQPDPCNSPLSTLLFKTQERVERNCDRDSNMDRCAQKDDVLYLEY